MSLKKGFENKDSIIKLVDISTIVISFLAILYSKNIQVRTIGLLIIYLAIRNLIKEFVFPLK